MRVQTINLRQFPAKSNSDVEFIRRTALRAGASVFETIEVRQNEAYFVIIHCTETQEKVIDQAARELFYNHLNERADQC